MDLFISRSDWWYDAIIELIHTKGFIPKEEFVAARLGITIDEAKQSIARLVSLGLIKIMPNKSWVASNENTIIYGEEQTNLAFLKLQRQLLDKAIDALERVAKKHRQQSSMLMAINKKDLPEVRKRIKDFHHDLCKFLERPNREADEVYQLVTTIFPLTNLEEKKDSRN